MLFCLLLQSALRHVEGPCRNCYEEIVLTLMFSSFSNAAILSFEAFV